MPTTKIPAAFYRGGSSKGVIFHERDLPVDAVQRDALFLHVIGSPDPYQRQLNGLGGGVSSLSKVVIVAPSARDDADIDYTFAQVAVDQAVVDYGSMCGNMSAAVGPFAVDEGLLAVDDGDVTVRVCNTNTNKIYHARFTVADGLTIEEGDFVIPGVTGSGAKITLHYQDPGGAVTATLLPSGQPINQVTIPDLGDVQVSLVDASNPVVYVRAADLGLNATEHPERLEGDHQLMDRLDRIRRAGGVLMGMHRDPGGIGLSNPKVAIVGPPAKFQAIDQSTHPANSHDLGIRIVSMQRIHRAVTLTGALCTATAAHIPGTIVNEIVQQSTRISDHDPTQLRVGNPSGILPVSAQVVRTKTGDYHAESATSYRTQRRLMEGYVRVPAELLE